MREFFKGWRRKAGIVSLVFALGMWAGWVRSLRGIEFTTLNNATMTLLSVPNTIGLVIVKDGESIETSYFYENPQFYETTEWSWRFCGFGAGRLKRDLLMAHIADDGTIVHHSLPPAIFASLYAIPYWSLILPLTLLSAYLILWPKQKRSGNSVQDR